MRFLTCSALLLAGLSLCTSARAQFLLGPSVFQPTHAGLLAERAVVLTGFAAFPESTSRVENSAYGVAAGLARPTFDFGAGYTRSTIRYEDDRGSSNDVEAHANAFGVYVHAYVRETEELPLAWRVGGELAVSLPEDAPAEASLSEITTLTGAGVSHRFTLGPSVALVPELYAGRAYRRLTSHYAGDRNASITSDALFRLSAGLVVGAGRTRVPLTPSVSRSNGRTTPAVGASLVFTR